MDGNVGALLEPDGQDAQFPKAIIEVDNVMDIDGEPFMVPSPAASSGTIDASSVLDLDGDPLTETRPPMVELASGVEYDQCS